MKHYIYEIQGVKVGCTKNLEARVALYNGKYKLEDLTVLGVLENKTDKEAGEIEREYQVKLGYSVDRSLYCQSIENLTKGIKKSHDTNRLNKTGFCYDKKIQSKAGKISVEVNRKNGTGFWNSELQSELGKRGGKIGGKKSNESQKLKGIGVYSKIKCKYCDCISDPGNINRWHNEKCKYKSKEV